MTKIFRTYHYLLLEELRDTLILFLNKHNYALSDIVFQCDSDCRNIIRDMGLHYSDPKYAHMLSDIVAWFNNKNSEPKGVISVNLTTVIKDKLIKKLTR